jgi:hypothetical protein
LKEQNFALPQDVAASPCQVTNGGVSHPRNSGFVGTSYPIIIEGAMFGMAAVYWAHWMCGCPATGNNLGLETREKELLLFENKKVLSVRRPGRNNIDIVKTVAVSKQWLHHGKGMPA